jgi:hypothetical protein
MSGTFDLSLDTRIAASPRQVSCDVADETVLLSLDNGEYFGLNEVGASIWRLIQEPRSVGEVRDALLSMYDGIAADDCLAHVLAFVQELHGLGLVELR